MAHLWNSQHWTLANTDQVWMSEGGANYFSRNALLNFKYISRDEYIKNFKSQADTCIKALNGGSVNNLHYRSDAYVCGEVIYQLSALMIGATNNLEVWNKIVSDGDVLNYSEKSFIQAFYKAKVNKADITSIENILNGQNENTLSELIKKYAGE